MIRLLTMLFYGTIFWLGSLFLFESGLYYNYIKANHIALFFNPFFAQTQIWWLWPVGIALFGYLFLSEHLGNRWKLALLLPVFLAAASPWYPPVGEKIGERLFAREGMHYRFGKIDIENVKLLYHTKKTDFVRLPDGKVAKYPVSNRVSGI